MILCYIVAETNSHEAYSSRILSRIGIHAALPNRYPMLVERIEDWPYRGEVFQRYH